MMVLKNITTSFFLLFLVQGIFATAHIDLVNASKPVNDFKTGQYEGLSPDFRCSPSDLPQDVIDILVQNKIALERQVARRAPERHHDLAYDYVLEEHEQTEFDLYIKDEDGTELDVTLASETNVVEVVHIPETSHIPNESEMTTAHEYLRAGLKLYRAGDIICALDAMLNCLRLDIDNFACQQWHEQIREVGKSIAIGHRAMNNKNYQECINEAQRILMLENDEPMIIFQAMRLECSCMALNDNNARALVICGKTLSIKIDEKVYKSRAFAFERLGLHELAHQDQERAAALRFKLSNSTEEEFDYDELRLQIDFLSY